MRAICSAKGAENAARVVPHEAKQRREPDDTPAPMARSVVGGECISGAVLIQKPNARHDRSQALPQSARQIGGPRRGPCGPDAIAAPGVGLDFAGGNITFPLN